jgi:hypothetical protein
MKSQYKPFLITILIECLIALIFRQFRWFEYDNTFFLNHIIEWILIAIILPVIWLIWNNKEKNTKYLKIWLIIIEIYLFLLIFVQDWSNLNIREFSILYITLLLIIKESIYKREKKWQTNFFLSIYTIISVIIICTWLLMRYRNPIDMNNIINSKNYHLITNLDENISKNYSTITLKNNYYSNNISILSWKNNYSLIKNIDYTLNFSSKTDDKNNYILIQDQLWNILKIPPQTLINFSTKNQQIQFIDNNRNTEYYSINSNFPEELKEYKTNYNNEIKNDILKTLPSMLRNNSKLQKISVSYTKILWTIFPFRYKDNIEILNEYIPYFSLTEKESYWSIKNINSLIKENQSIWINKINWWSKYRIF